MLDGSEETRGSGAGAGYRNTPSSRQRSVGARVDRARYLIQQQGLAVALGIPGRLVSLVLSPRQVRPSRTAIAILERRYRDLLARDLDNVERGVYPRDLLYQLPVFEYLRCLPYVLFESPRFLLRGYRGDHDDLPTDLDVTSYPPYYRRTFHWQGDGWLSARSAKLYDVGVEILFGGTGDVMRRMAIPPVVEGTARAAKPRILDVGCGTGRFLLQLHRALPRAKLYGLDLSPYYVKRAAEVLSPAVDVSLVVENAEDMPFSAKFFDAVTSVFLFHELPRGVRRAVVREAYRVLKPGGFFVVNDSAQLSDSGELRDVLYAFPNAYHEPYYKSYLRDDLAALMRECGFGIESESVHLVSKVVVGRKPS
jgi:ubiquinone/menaquinone biosynthesis C-methylase UbiE